MSSLDSLVGCDCFESITRRQKIPTNCLEACLRCHAAQPRDGVRDAIRCIDRIGDLRSGSDHSVPARKGKFTAPVAKGSGALGRFGSGSYA